MRKTNNHTYEKSVEERFKQEHPKLSKIIEIAISWGHDFEYDLSNLKEVILWYNNQLQSHIRLAIKYGYSIDILSQPFMSERNICFY